MATNTSIQDFKSRMTRGGARSNQFRCLVTFPEGVSGGSTAMNDIPFLAKAASIPSSSVADIEIMYRGRPVHFAGERTFQPWQIMVYNDNDFRVRGAFEDWINNIAHATDVNGLMNPADYQRDILVEQLDRSGESVATYLMQDAFPTQVGDIQLSWDENNRIQEYGVVFSYNYFTRTSPDSQTA